MSVMGAGLIRPEGAQPAKPIDPNFVPYLAGVPITGVSGIGPARYRSGSRYAVRCPDLVVTEPVSLMCAMHWTSAAYQGDGPNAVLQAQLVLYSQPNDTFERIFRVANHQVVTDDDLSGGGAIVGRVKVDAGTWYVAGAFVGAGGALPDEYLVSSDPILLDVRPLERADVAPAFYTRRTAHKLSVFDTSVGNTEATTVWGESDAVTSVREDGTTVYIHSHAADAEVAVHASNAKESAGARKTASTEQVYQPHSDTNAKYGSADPLATYGTPGLTY